MPGKNGARRPVERSPDEDSSKPAEVDWDSPRWREGDDVQGDVERDRRLHGDRAPSQHGAVDESGSLDPESKG